jgi:hypothetical protein
MPTTCDGAQSEGENARNRRECVEQRREYGQQGDKAREGKNKIEGACRKGLVSGAAGGAHEVQLCVLLRLVQGFGAGDGSRDGVRESDPEIGGQ